ncbi:hypothetical protein BUALT_Bualt15G0091100 [Buddleja alternifolia]|uniref:UPF3 domain-containing protein n=1 Tax=Buddleja alternifolia TaxID=168488 RepID=A0AAV6WPE9_9LAMI|nr:hypothetical protein BUALT_Bualt15G0091100 [Buddleja alternifolia]
MKVSLDRTKVVLRHLPPTISRSNLVERVDSGFSGRYRWLSFCPGKFSPKHLTYSRAYINFKKPDDVIEFAEFFNGHVFVNEKGTQFKAIVEYAPSQRVPKQWSKNDGREGTILKDPEYLEFLEFLAKPVENLPSAEIQLERKEAERAGAPKDVPVVTPLMDYVRQKRAAKGGARRAMLNGKPARRVSGMSSRSPSHVLREEAWKRGGIRPPWDSSKIVSSKGKSTYLLVPKQDDQKIVDKSFNIAAVSGNEALEDGSGGSGEKKILLLKGTEKEISSQNAATPKISHYSAHPKQNQQREASGRIIRSILLNRDTRQNGPSSMSQSEMRIQDREKRPPLPPSVHLFQKNTNGTPEDKVVINDLRAVYMEKQERRTRNKDRPDRGVWTPFRRSDGSHASEESSLHIASEKSQVVQPAEGTHVELKHDMLANRGGGYGAIGSGRGSYYSVDNGSYRQGGRRGSVYNVKDADGSSIMEGKPLKRGGPNEVACAVNAINHLPILKQYDWNSTEYPVSRIGGDRQCLVLETVEAHQFCPDCASTHTGCIYCSVG